MTERAYVLHNGNFSYIEFEITSDLVNALLILQKISISNGTLLGIKILSTYKTG